MIVCDHTMKLAGTRPSYFPFLHTPKKAGCSRVILFLFKKFAFNSAEHEGQSRQYHAVS